MFFKAHGTIPHNMFGNEYEKIKSFQKSVRDCSRLRQGFLCILGNLYFTLCDRLKKNSSDNSTNSAIVKLN